MPIPQWITDLGLGAEEAFEHGRTQARLEAAMAALREIAKSRKGTWAQVHAQIALDRITPRV
jgi:hypothetical protein